MLEESIQDILERIWPDWKILDELPSGEGAYGTVFKAIRKDDLAGDSKSAIKVIVISPENEDTEILQGAGYSPEQVRTFFTGIVKEYSSEIKTMESLKGHSNIVSIDDYKIIELENDVTVILIRMELLNKVDFGGLSEEETVKLGVDICSALEACRKKNIIHRDLKPDNILVNDIGDYKLGDFGVAKVLDRVSENLSMKGTPSFMAPEVFHGTANDVDIDDAAKADIYSLGVVLYYICNNRRIPFLNPDKQIHLPKEKEEAFYKRINGEPVPPLSRFSEELRSVIYKACAFKASDRYSNATEMKDALLGTQRRKVVDDTRGKDKDVNTLPGPVNKIHFPKWVWPLAATVCILIAFSYFMLCRPSLDNQSLYHISFYPAKNMNLSAYTSARSILKERLTTLMGGETFSMEENGNQIEVSLPEVAFGEEDVEYVIKTYISRAINLYLVNANDLMNSDDNPEFFPVYRSDIERVVLQDGVAPVSNSTEIGDYNQYILIKFTDDFVNKYSEKYGSWKKIVLMQDFADAVNGYGWELLPTTDNKTFAIIDRDKGEHFSEVLAYNLSHDPYQEHFLFSIDENDPYDWEKIDDSVQSTSGTQCNANSFEEGTITFVLEPLNPITDGQLLDYKKALRIRMDALNLPYALGTRNNDANTLFAIKTLPLHISEELINLIGSKSGAELRLNNCYASVSVESIEWSGQDNIQIRLSDYSSKETIETLKEVADYTNEKAVLFIDGFPFVVVSNIQSLMDTRMIVSDSICSIEEGKIVSIGISEETRWIVNFLKARNETAYLMDSILFPRTFTYNAGAKEQKSDKTELPISISVNVRQLERDIQEIHPDAEVQYKTGDLWIYLHLSTDEWLPERAIKLMEKFYMHIKPDDLYVNYLRFIITDENNAFNERARVIFTRNRVNINSSISSSDVISQMGGFQYTTWFHGNKLESYGIELEQLLVESDVFQK